MESGFSYLWTDHHSRRWWVSHRGDDARATELGEDGEWNAGQLVRERHGCEALSVGFSSYQGSVTATADWDGPAEYKRMRPARLERAIGVVYGPETERLSHYSMRVCLSSSTPSCTWTRRTPSSRSSPACRERRRRCWKPTPPGSEWDGERPLCYLQGGAIWTKDFLLLGAPSWLRLSDRTARW